jgi:hypothetical protein
MNTPQETTPYPCYLEDEIKEHLWNLADDFDRKRSAGEGELSPLFSVMERKYDSICASFATMDRYNHMLMGGSLSLEKRNELDERIMKICVSMGILFQGVFSDIYLIEKCFMDDQTPGQHD